MSKQLVLASGSPRRKALLEQLGLDIIVRVSDVDETGTGTPEETVLENARLKCDAIARDADENEIVIAADTIVVYENSILEKPRDLDDARSMLQRLSGNTHQVLTAVVLSDVDCSKIVKAVEPTDVTFRDLSHSEIERFVEIVRPLDRAGAYTVDGPGSLLVERYDGCYYNVLGLPLVRLNELLHDLDYDIFPNIDPEKTQFL